MTTIRTADPTEIPHVIGETDPQRAATTAAYLTELLAKGCTRPEWCFVAETGGRSTGSVVLWSMPGKDVPSDIVLLHAPWDEPDLATGRRLLTHAGDAARAAGAVEQGHVLDSPAQPPQHQDQPHQRRQLLLAEGFHISRDGHRYRWTADRELPLADDRLRWRSLADLGPEPFLGLLTDLVADTRDALIAADVAELGPRGAAELLWTESLAFHHEPHWYEIGHDADGSAAAISLPAHSPTYPVIGFVGVAPRHRGNGYAAATVARGTHLLAAAGATEIRGDCDADNIAMVRGFERAGYDAFAQRLEFRRRLVTR
ncbi:GNAT family N-acetyltransferase [Micromonospora sp. URMC 106]|uniref:GNAT family N-acetyltransferase n=1 Tax=Micromonospora sp. URMC 106 TaxID=3423408 RepID=UPI003F1B63FA